jgi:hypothetical protein
MPAPDWSAATLPLPIRQSGYAEPNSALLRGLLRQLRQLRHKTPLYRVQATALLYGSGKALYLFIAKGTEAICVSAYSYGLLLTLMGNVNSLSRAMLHLPPLLVLY